MVSKATLISEITTKVGSALTAYRIGLTHDLAERKKYWGQTEKEDLTTGRLGKPTLYRMPKLSSAISSIKG